MLKRVLYFIALFPLLFISQYSFAQFPYNESFKNKTAPGIIFGGEPNKAFLTAATGLDPEGDGYLRLTTAQKFQKGFIYSTTSFPSANGLRVEVEYYIYGGAGTGADGITFFLFDATALETFQIGGFGGSLGYAQYTDPKTNQTTPGVSKGYLGIGLDEFGNFSNPTEGRQGGVKGPVGQGRSPSSVTLRGQGNGAGLDTNNYKYLESVKTDTIGFPLSVGGTRKPNSSDPGYRKVFLDLQPARDGKPGYLITVRITTGGTIPTTHNVIEYYYPEPAPPNLAYGIASSTGEEVNIHEIRNITIDAYDKNPVAGSLADTLCSYDTFTTDLTKLVSSYNGTVVTNSSFDLNPSVAGRQSTVTNEKGTFTLNSSGLLTFVPANAQSTGMASLSYTVTDNLNRSSEIATIALTLVPLPAADAGQDQDLRISTATGTATLKGNHPEGSTGVWTQLSGPVVTLSDPNADETNISNMSPGTYTFQWTLTSGGCTQSDEVRILVINPTVPTAVDDIAETLASQAVTISPLVNDTFESYPANPGSVTVVTNPAQGTVAVIPGTGRITYTPRSAFSGKDTFTYTVKNTNGIVSNIATVTITVRPVGSTDEVVIPVNTPINIEPRKNDLSAAGTTVQAVSAPSNGSVVYNQDGTVTYTPKTDYNGPDSFTYRLITSDGITSDPINVGITVNILPVAADDIAPPTSGGPVEIDVTSNDTDADGNVIKGTVIITEQPKHGTVTVDPVTGNVIYTPDPGYFGPDSFTYVIKDDKGSTSQPGTVQLTVLLPPKIGLAKAAARIQQALNGTYDVDFIFTVKNFGGDPLENISLRDDLADAFSGAEITVRDMKVVGSGLVINRAFNGVSNTELLDPSSTLAPGAIELVAVTVNIRLISREGIFNNSAFVRGFSTFFNLTTEDQSTNGLRPDPLAEGDVSYSDPTPLELLAPPLFIPGGFSPNNDGINDLFVIQNKITKRLSLEIFNRWGNRIYKSADYQNDWDGKCTEGISAGELVPNGTYYYVVVIEGTERRAGYITINR